MREARSRGGLHLWWLGQSGFLVQWEGHHLLLDPYLSESLTKKYAATDKPHVRMTERVIAPERLDFVEAVTSSHNHTDHLDGETLGPLLRANPALRIVVPEANRAFAADRLKADPASLLGCDDGVTVEVGPFRITGTPSAHEEVERDERGHCRYLGYVVRTGPGSIYHSGDSMLYDGMGAALRALKPDVALLPINGRAPERRVPGNMNGPEAARLAREMGARIAIPHHYEMFEFNTASPDAFVAEAERLGVRTQVLRGGARWTP